MPEYNNDEIEHEQQLEKDLAYLESYRPRLPKYYLSTVTEAPVALHANNNSKAQTDLSR